MSIKKAFLVMLCTVSLYMRAESSTDLEILNPVITISDTSTPCAESPTTPSSLTRLKNWCKEKKVSKNLQQAIVYAKRTQRIYQGYIFSSFLESHSSIFETLPIGVTNALKHYKYAPKTFKFLQVTEFKNAAVAYFGDTSPLKYFNKIIIGEPLLDILSPDELEFVLSHELEHAVHKDGINRLRLILVLYITPYLISYSVHFIKKRYDKKSYPRLHNLIEQYEIYENFFNDNPLIGYVIRSLIVNIFSRYCEKRADIEGAIKTGKALAGAQVFRKFEKIIGKAPLWEKILHPISWLYPDHPSFKTRIQYLTDLAK